MGFIFLPLMFLVLWAIVILPQQRRMRAHQALVSVLKEGDEVMTTSGILGTISAMDDVYQYRGYQDAVSQLSADGGSTAQASDPKAKQSSSHRSNG